MIKMAKKPGSKVSYTNQWSCPRCDPKDHNGPCPRGGCEAIIVGRFRTVTNTTYEAFNKLKQILVNQHEGSIYFHKSQIK